MRIPLILLMFLTTSLVSVAQQDTVLFLKGTTSIVNITEFSATEIRYDKFLKKNGKVLDEEGMFEGYRVFSVTKGGERTILYKQDTMVGNIRTLKEMSAFLQGEMHAYKYFQPKAAFYTGIGLGIGVSLYDTYLGQGAVDQGEPYGMFRQKSPSILPLLTTFLYPVAVIIPKFPLNTANVKDRALLLDENFLDGYDRTARTKRVFKSLHGKLIGVGIGYAAWGVAQIFLK